MAASADPPGCGRSPREAIPVDAQMLVWQRDGGGAYAADQTGDWSSVRALKGPRSGPAWGSETPIRARTVPVRSADAVPPPSSSAPSSVSSSAVANKAETTEARTSRSSSAAISFAWCSGRRADRSSVSSIGSSSQRRVGSSRVSAGSPSSSPRQPSSAGTASSYAGSGPTAGPVAQAGHRSIPRSVRSSSAGPAGAASGALRSKAPLNDRARSLVLRAAGVVLIDPQGSRPGRNDIGDVHDGRDRGALVANHARVVARLDE